MMGGLIKTVRYRAILEKDKRYDGIFYFVVKNTTTYCRPSCLLPRRLQSGYSFFDTIDDAAALGYQACTYCRPDKLKNDLSLEILHKIDAGAINTKGVHGLADSLHVSERHLRRIVPAKTGTSPQRLNKTIRLATAERLVTQTNVPITEIAFSADFSSLRQFNAVFKEAFKVSPRQMRKAAARIPQGPSSANIPLRLSYRALLQNSITATLTNKGSKL